MKTAYELAMERLNKTAPTVKLSAEQKKQIAELESKYAAKIAERDLFLKGEIVKAVDKGDFELVEQLEKQLVNERKGLQADLEEKKAKAMDKWVTSKLPTYYIMIADDFAQSCPTVQKYVSKKGF